MLKLTTFDKDAIYEAMQQCRIGTLALFEGIDNTSFCKQAHPEFSPAGWHLGHIAYTEALWILERCAGLPPLFPEYRQLLSADGLPKGDRKKLPPLSNICDYLDTVRSQVLSYLKNTSLDGQERLWHFLIQHESQHTETIAFVLQLQRWHLQKELNLQNEQLKVSETLIVSAPLEPAAEMIKISAGEFEMGSNSVEAMDNERSLHRVHLDSYWIDRYPVTCNQYRLFINAEGYRNPEWWIAEGWEWLQKNSVEEPLYWSNNPAWNNHPVCGVSWYEADAYAKFVGKRLPTEAEWEKAASWDDAAKRRCTYPWGNAQPDASRCNHDNNAGCTTPVNAYPAGQSAYGCYDFLGNVWEWTSSWFDSYEGFVSYPYRGYSQTYFDKQHRVLKGSSWATRPWSMRSSFRNWYYPEIRQILAGFRCVRDAG
jgi:gamma-glutamyl hercynylcysteine S-oxide synthase